jgi:hypothetical protein
MTYATVVSDLFSRLPRLQATYRTNFGFMGDEEPGPYIVFGSILIPALAEGLEKGDLGIILPVCAFLEDVSIAARQDKGLLALLRTELSGWLGWTANEHRLAPWLGSETKLICNYVPGLATQRLQLREDEKSRGVLARIIAKLSRTPKA